jgi:hypothetical protein
MLNDLYKLIFQRKGLNSMKYANYLTATVLTLALGMGHTQLANAQRAEPNRGDQRQERRERMRQMTPEERQKYFEQRQAERLKQMTPEERQAWTARRQQWQQQMQEQMIQNLTPEQRQALIDRLQNGDAGQPAPGPVQTVEDAQRALLNSGGITDKEVQDAIIAFVNEQNKAREPLSKQARQLSSALADPATTGDQASALLQSFRDASTQHKENYKNALAQLDAKISYTTDPRLESMLTLIGILGDESQLAGGFPVIFPRGVAEKLKTPAAKPQPQPAAGPAAAVNE